MLFRIPASLCLIFIPLLFGLAVASCSCTGKGHGDKGLARGFPSEYGTSCKAWDDGDCKAHACGSAKQCDTLWPDTTTGTWCCNAWCYVDPNDCTESDVQPSVLSSNGTSTDLYYSYQACEDKTRVTYAVDTCPWQEPITFTAAYAAIVVAEKISKLLAHEADGIAMHATIQTATDELAVTAGNDARLCVFTLRSYGGTRAFCTSPQTDPVKSLALTAEYVMTAKEGGQAIDFWEIANSSSSTTPKLAYFGQISTAATKPIQYLKYLDGFGLLSSTEDGFVSVWDVNSITRTNINSKTAVDRFGPFTWAPGALEQVTFGGKLGVACSDYADIEIWTRNSGSWTQNTRLSGHSRLVTSLTYLASMGLLASASLDSNVGLWHFIKGAWRLATYLYDHSKPVRTAVWIAGPLLATGDEESLILWRPATSATCDFSYVRGYYLAGFNKYEFQSRSVAACQELCCENAWCQSFDYAYKADGATHGDMTCWLSQAAEGKGGGTGLVWDPKANYDYYEIQKRGTRFMTLEQQNGVNRIVLAKASGLLVSDNNKDGVLDVWKITSSSCPDGQMSKGDGATCKLCPLGRAGTGGICSACPAGQVSAKEGLLKCTPCPPGNYIQTVGGTKCLPCARGSYATNSSTAECTECSPGTFSSKLGASRIDSCVQCDPGHYSEQSGGSACAKCPAGKSHDRFASSSKNDCTSCTFCGTKYADGNSNACPVPKDGSCSNCPVGMVSNDGAYCAYCPLGNFPDGNNVGCDQFKDGSFDAVVNINNRQCLSRAEYKQHGCPLQENEGWGINGYRPKDTASMSYKALNSTENKICSALHCMGAYYELAVIANRQTASSECTLDSSLKQLCEWTKSLLNSDLDKREAEAQRLEAASELQQRLNMCRPLCKPHDLCAQVTAAEKAKETAFEVLPFKLESHEFRGLRCYAKCTSERPPKTIEKGWDCMSQETVRKIIVPRTRIPRCEASCSACPSGAWKSGSFRNCGKGAAIATAPTSMKLSKALVVIGVVHLLHTCLV